MMTGTWPWPLAKTAVDMQTEHVQVRALFKVVIPNINAGKLGELASQKVLETHGTDGKGLSGRSRFS